MKTIAYIDGANLHQGVKNLGWRLDYARFRVWLQDKYKVEAVYLFIGLVPKNKNLYTALQEIGYILVYKEVTYDGDGKVKGNCDADLVLKMTADCYENHYDKAILISSDGDYAGLVSFLKERGKFRALISPSSNCSFLLRKLNISIVYLDSKKNTLQKR
jgi:uncharacterized LabA/DUF88 family protein